MGRLFTIKQSGSFENIESFLYKMANDTMYSQLEEYGQYGVDVLAANTPDDTGLTAASWGYAVLRLKTRSSITWFNTHLDDNGNTPVVILLQYGHATGTGGYVQGYDFINPTMREAFNTIADGVWKAVVQA